jgi:hypothetical protein
MLAKGPGFGVLLLVLLLLLPDDGWLAQPGVLVRLAALVKQIMHFLFWAAAWAAKVQLAPKQDHPAVYCGNCSGQHLLRTITWLDPRPNTMIRMLHHH